MAKNNQYLTERSMVRTCTCKCWLLYTLVLLQQMVNDYYQEEPKLLVFLTTSGKSRTVATVPCYKYFAPRNKAANPVLVNMVLKIENSKHHIVYGHFKFKLKTRFL